MTSSPSGPAAEERGEVVWTPAARRTASRLGSFCDWLVEVRGLCFDGYTELWSWSVRDLEGFWSAVAEWSGVQWHDRPTATLAHGDGPMPGPEFFPGATINYGEHALAAWSTAPTHPAVVARSQTRARLELSGAELRDQVARCRAGLRALGVQRGDRVAAYAPNIPETLVAFLACASLGAVWSSCPPEFGVRSVVDRLSQIEPVVLFAVDGYRYGAKAIERAEEVAAITASLPSLRHVVRIPYLHGDGRVDGDWPALLEHEGPLEFTPVPFDHPLYVLFSSGTTGLPKAIVHGHGGITVEHLKVLALHNDLGPGSRFSWFTTTGWMMWNYLVSGLAVGATIVLFDGDPGFPDLTALWAFAAEEQLTFLGVSAPFLMACRKAELDLSALDLTHLRSVGSTGAPLPPAGFRWVRDAVGAHVQVESVAGGTDVCTGFVGMAPTLAVRAGEISCRLLGCAVEAFDPDGRPCPPGVQGELVVTRPMPSMPVGLWNDPDGSRYRAAYFDDFPGVWRHGDWITIFEDGACVISGRSDATLNRGGVRLGTADFYAVVEAMPEVADSLVVHLDDGDSDELLLFVALSGGAVLDDDLAARIVGTIRRELSPRHVPDEVLAVPGIPRTLSGKKLEVPVKRILLGAPAEVAASAGSLVDARALEHFVALAAERRRSEAHRAEQSEVS